MEDLFHAFVLSIIQGVTEFLPVSSSAHLIFVPSLLGWQDQGQAFDIATHIGTLFAVLLYFRKDLKCMAVDWWHSLWNNGYRTHHSNLVWAILFGTIPVGLAGFILKPFVETHLRSNIVIACATLGFAFLLWLSHWLDNHKRTQSSMTWKDVLVIGCAQVLALIPGTSRSGIVLTASLMRGFTRQAAANYTFLLSIPVILLAGGLEGFKLVKNSAPVAWELLGFSVVISAISGYLCINIFITILNRLGVMPFVCYRILLGIMLMFFLWM